MTDDTSGDRNPADRTARVVRVDDLVVDTIRLDVFLAQQPEFEGRSDAKALVVEGLVFVEGRLGKAGQQLKSGQTVEFDLSARSTKAIEPLVPSDVPVPKILFEDPYLLVIDKPAGLVAHPPNTNRANILSVSAWAEAHSPGLPVVGGEDRPGIVHRLDKETSGVMVLAKTEEAFHFLKGEFQERRVRKEYQAICFGEARFQSDYIERNIATHPQKGDRMVIAKEGGRSASTYYEVVERFVGFTLFACRPKTGRTHQIRVHMTSVGHSLVADRFYRARNHASARLPPEAPNPGRHCLHARHLSFRHPQSHQELTFGAELPADLVALLDWLRQARSP